MMPKILAKFQRDHPNGAPNKGGVGSSRYISEMMQYMDMEA